MAGRRTTEIKTDSRYAPGKDGWPGEGDSSVSGPVSVVRQVRRRARADRRLRSSGLPAGQRCG